MRLIMFTFSCTTALFLGLTSTHVHASLLDCTGCHAEPGDMRPLDSVYRNITTGGFPGNHRTHMAPTATAAECAGCHINSNFQTDHRDRQIQLASRISNYSSVLGRAAYRTSRPTVSDGNAIFFNQTSVPMPASCTNVNCHFETTTPIWGTDAATAGFNCSSCHGNPPAGTPGNNYYGGAAGSHGTHSTVYSFACSKCHSDHTLDTVPFAHATSIGKRSLVVSPEDVHLYFGTYTSDRDRNYLPGQAASHVFGSCTAIYCHSDGTSSAPPYATASGTAPRWGVPASAACGSCHKATGGDPVSSGSHTAHFTPNNYGPKMGTALSACQNCHSYSNGAATHVNGTVDKTPCTPCHRGTEPAWGAGITACQDCHGKNGTSVMNNMSAPDKWSYSSQPVGRDGAGGHSAADVDCSSASCHNAHSLASPEPDHISGLRGDYRGLKFDMDPRTGVAASGNDTCQPCHTIAVQRSHVTSRNDSSPAMICNKCHDPHGSGNLQMVRAGIWYDPAQPPVTISFSNRSTFVKYSAPYDGLCQTCHTQTNHFRRGEAEAAGAGQHGNTTNRDCTSCHQHGVSGSDSVSFAFQSPRCDTCHGYPPVSSMALYGRQNMFSTAKLQNYPDSGGAHTAFGHLAPSIKATDPNPWQACQPCHSGGSATHRLAAASAQVPISGTYNAKSGSAGYASTCSNVSCHGGADTASGASPAWTATPGWFLPNGDFDVYAEGRLNDAYDTICLQCHAINPVDNVSATPENNSVYSGLDQNATFATNLHYGHIYFMGYTCTDCHDHTNSKLGKSSAHFASLSSASMGNAWKTINTALFEYTSAPETPVGSKGSCNNTACHSGSESRIW